MHLNKLWNFSLFWVFKTRARYASTAHIHLAHVALINKTFRRFLYSCFCSKLITVHEDFLKTFLFTQHVHYKRATLITSVTSDYKLLLRNIFDFLKQKLDNRENVFRKVGMFVCVAIETSKRVFMIAVSSRAHFGSCWLVGSLSSGC